MQFISGNGQRHSITRHLPFVLEYPQPTMFNCQREEGRAGEHVFLVQRTNPDWVTESAVLASSTGSTRAHEAHMSARYSIDVDTFRRTVRFQTHRKGEISVIHTYLLWRLPRFGYSMATVLWYCAGRKQTPLTLKIASVTRCHKGRRSHREAYLPESHLSPAIKVISFVVNKPGNIKLWCPWLFEKATCIYHVI